MSGSGYRTFTAGQTLTAAQVQGYLMKQVTMYFGTTAARDAAITAPEAGMQVYIDGTYDLWQVYNGSAWVTYRARGAGTPEGNVTAAVGSIYQRTDGAAGSTIYVKESGSGNTGWTAIVATSRPLANGVATVQVVSTTAESDLFSYTVPGGTLAAGDLVRVSAHGDMLNNTGSNQTPIFRLKLGATNIFAEGSVNYSTNASRRAWRFSADLFAETASAQRSMMELLVTDPGGAGNDPVAATSGMPVVGVNSSSEATASDKALKLAVQLGASSANFDVRLLAYKVELIKGV